MTTLFKCAVAGLLAVTLQLASAPTPAAAHTEDATWLSSAFGTSAGRETSQRPVSRLPGARHVSHSKRSRSVNIAAPSRRSTSLSGGLSWQAPSGCVPGQLRGVLSSLASDYGPVTITSTCRGRAQNRAAGGAGHSYHLTGQAVDFRVHGNVSAVYASLRSNGDVGGLKHYGGGLFHIDTGPRRSW